MPSQELKSLATVITIHNITYYFIVAMNEYEYNIITCSLRLNEERDKALRTLEYVQ